MKKTVSMMVAALMVCSGGMAAFADSQMNLTDIAGTKYETAVKELISRNIISGYPEDNTFRPQNSITRAEACVVIANALGASEADLKAAKESGFSDLAGYSWAEKYINYAAEKGIVKGYGDGSFKPGANVTYNEIAVILVNACGIQSSELTGAWPENYIAKAKELGMLQAVMDGAESFDTGAAATRGNVALMTFSAADKITQANKPEEKPDGSENAGDKESGMSSTGSLAEYTGNATGMINGVSRVRNKDGESVYQLEFLMGSETMYLNTDTKTVPGTISYDGSLYTLKLQNGVVKDISTKGGRLKNFAELTGGWTAVNSRDSRILTMGDGTQLTVMKDAVFYEADLDGGSIDSYSGASLSSIAKGCKIRAYDVTDDKTANADIIVVVKASDAGKL